MDLENLNQRSWKLLQLLIERYIRDGQPIASKVLANETQLSLSSATIRNVMADLESAGYLHSPHTSAGRVPTSKAYRLFVNNLLKAQSMTEDLLSMNDVPLDPRQNTGNLLQNASKFLSDFTKLTGIVTTPKQNQVNLKHIEFLPLSENRVLTILVFHDHEIQNRIIYTDRVYTKAELQQITNLINETYAGSNLMTVREKLLVSMRRDRESMNVLMQSALEMAQQAFDATKQDVEDYVMSGESNLLTFAETTGFDRLRALFDAFTEKQTVINLLDKCLQTSGIQIFIGKESGYEEFDDFSVITAPYEADGEILGVLGVIGPTRMHYDRAISAVDMTARLLSAALK